MQPSPYTPGVAAEALFGRAAVLAEFNERLAVLAGLGRLIGRIRVDHGPRGVGKTSLLREVQRRAEMSQLATVWVTAGRPATLLDRVAEALAQVAPSWGAPGRRLLAMTDLDVEVGVPGLARVGARAAVRGSGDHLEERAVERLLVQAVDAAAGSGRRGLVLFVDEIQDADPESLRVVAATWQHLQSERPDLALAMFSAGLPGSVEHLARAATFPERFQYRQLTRLTDEASALALVEPARAAGVEWDPAAVRAVVGLARGYPYAVQLYAEGAWQAAGHPDPRSVVTSSHVKRGAVLVADDFAALHRGRWLAATSGERRLLQAMAELGGDDVSRSDLAAALGTDSRALSRARQSLIDKGVIEPVGRGVLSFTVPSFAAFVTANEE